MKIGVISDTHGLLRPEAVAALAGVDHIVHAGDIGSPDVIVNLRKIAPLTAIRGNVDTGEWASSFRDEEVVDLAGRTVYVIHNLGDLGRDPAAEGISIVVSGHSHKPAVETRDGVLYLNPGSAGPRRFTLPIALATLTLEGDSVEPQIHEILR